MSDPDVEPVKEHATYHFRFVVPSMEDGLNVVRRHFGDDGMTFARIGRARHDGRYWIHFRWHVKMRRGAMAKRVGDRESLQRADPNQFADFFEMFEDVGDFPKRSFPNHRFPARELRALGLTEEDVAATILMRLTQAGRAVLVS